MNLPEIEQKILKFWEKNNIFKKSLQKNKGKKNFVFFEGPPTANGRPGMHHVEARSFKDVIPRYKTMRGFFVGRKAGWDTHGLPVELEVEKQLGLKNKKEIEKYGIGKFNQKCRESVWKYKDEWEKLTERIAFWLDMENPYITYENYYIESLWFILKKIWDKGLMYKGFKVVPHCPRCVTTLSSHEVAQGYKTIKENSIYVKFKIDFSSPQMSGGARKGGGALKDEQAAPPSVSSSTEEGGDFDNAYFLVWTTTPWTLPANVALAINQSVVYCKVKRQKSKVKSSSQNSKVAEEDNEKYQYILAKDRLDIIDFEYEIIEEEKGKNLIGIKYEPLYKNPNQKETDLKVVAGDFVSTEEGTGIVHIAPAYGEDDLRTGQKKNLSTIHTVSQEGIVVSGYDIPGEGKFIKSADKDIVEDLKKRNLLFKEEAYEHEYPFCWRCDSPLLYYAKDSWFIKMSDLRNKLATNNKKINWEPAYIKDGRFGEFIKEAKDWAISRERFWGTPLPIWTCEKCGKQICIGSVSELKKLQVTSYKLQDLHRPFVDEIKLKCACGGEMQNAKEVIDVWFDSGAMPFAQWGYPHKNGSDKEFKANYPADYICEAIDQTRGWFYTLLAVATLMEHCGVVSASGGKDGAPYKNVICLGHVLDKFGKKMSKSRGNVVDPWEMCDKFGADTIRWYFYTVNQAGDPKKFDIKDLQDKNRRIFGTLYNSLVFFQTYAEKNFIPKKIKAKNLLDKWIVSRFNSLNEKVINFLEKYDIISAARLIEDFIDDLSNWHIRRSRERFQRPKDKTEKEEASQILHSALMDLAKLIAPFAPFVAEEIYQNLKANPSTSSGRKGSESVHLCDYPRPDKKLIDKKLEEQMKVAREIVAKGLALRMEQKIKIRQPLASLKLKTENEKLKINEELLELIKDEVNVKNVIIPAKGGSASSGDKNIQNEIELNTEITPELKEEGMARELVRQIQQMRKEAGLVPQNVITVNYQPLVVSSQLSVIISKWADYIKREIKAESIEQYKETGLFDLEKEINLEGEKIKIGIKKL
jgi:isoleucyl-tRNA synthetase